MKKEEFLNHPYHSKKKELESAIQSLQEDLEELDKKIENEISPQFQFMFHKKLGVIFFAGWVDFQEWKVQSYESLKILGFYERIPNEFSYDYLEVDGVEVKSVDLNDCEIISEEEAKKLIGFIEDKPEVKAKIEELEGILSNKFGDKKLKIELEKAGYTIEEKSKLMIPNDFHKESVYSYKDYQSYAFGLYIEFILTNEEALKHIKNGDYYVFTMRTVDSDDKDVSYNSFFIVTPNYGKKGKICYIVTKK